MHISHNTYGQKIAAFFLCLLLLLPCFPTVETAGQSGNQTVRAGIFYFDGYHMKNEEGIFTGYGIEFLNLVSEYSHLNFEYTGYDNSWNEMLSMLENGEIDVVTSARKIPEREEKFDFSLPIGHTNTVLSMQADNPNLRSGDYQTYDGMKIGILTGSSQNQILKDFANEKGFSYQAVEYTDFDNLSSDLQDGAIDAILSSTLRKPENEKTLDTIATENFYAIVRKNDTELLNEINYAIDQMDINEGDWANVLFYKYYGPVYSSVLSFTEREKAYIEDVISKKKSITVTANGDQVPYSYVKDGQLKGIIPDYFAEAMALARLPYEIVITDDPTSYDDLTNNNSADVIIGRRSPADSDPDLSHGFYTNTYLSTGVAEVTRNDFHGEVSTLAISDSQDTAPIWQQIVPDAEILHFPNRQATLQAVLDGKADAAYMYTYTAQVFVNNDPRLHFNIVNNVRFEFGMFIRNSCDHELVTILNKCINQIPDDTLNQLITKHTAYTPENLSLSQYMQSHPQTLIVVILMFALIIGIILALYLRTRWNKKIINAKEQLNRELGEQLAIVNTLSRDYLNVYAIDIVTQTAKIIKMEDHVPLELEPNSNDEYPYTPLLLHYIKVRVYCEDQPYITEALSLDKVLEELEANPEYTGSYRVQIDNKIHTYQFTFVRVENSAPHKDSFILAGLRNIDEIIRKEQEQKALLAEALAAAQHANNAKTTFLNNMSHDIRTPMNAIIGFTSLAASHIDAREQVQDYLDKIMTSSKHLLSLINDVLDMSRIESGKVRIEEKEASLSEILHDLKTIVQADVKAKQLNFYIDTLDVTNETIICDKLRLNQVLLNLLSNAMKYTNPGGTVSIRIIQTADAPKGFASYQFQIKDTGIGMSKEFLKHLFEPFEREQTSTVNGIQGTGLGLAITKNIVDMMNGTITVTSEEDKGSEFVVSFQFRIPDTPEQTWHLKELENCRALVVDEDAHTCMSIGKMLSSMGMRPDWTTLGKEAVLRTEFAEEQNNPFGVYIIDWLIPDMNGVEVVRQIRKIVGDTPPILLLTSYDWADIEEEAIKAGVTAFCSKPIFLSDLCKALSGTNANEKPVKKISPESFTGKKILLVEDNELNQEIAKTLLEKAGFIIDTAADGTIAVDKITQAPDDAYDLILMDIQMPTMDGYEATRLIRAMENSAKASIPIVAMTANAFDEDRQQALNAGMDNHVSKPIDMPTLMDTLKEILKP